MREIKFRAWLKEWSDEGGKMFDKCLPLGGWDKWWIVLDDSHNSYDGEFTLGKDCEIMQYTGLKDKNGKEIYEGDVLEHEYEKRLLLWEVCYREGRFGVVCNNNGYRSSFYGVDSSSFFSERIIIGNIYENPELTNPQE